MRRRVPPAEQGLLQGAVASLTSTADGVGPFVFGGLYSATAGAGTGPVAGVAFVIAGLLLAGVFLMTWRGPLAPAEAPG